MKSFTTAVITLATGAAAVAVPAVTSAADLSQASATPAHAPHTADHAPVVNPGVSDVSQAAETVSQVCIDFTSDNNNWSFTKQNPWGSGSGTFGSLPGGKMCVPTSNSAGGALFIGPDANPGPGSTKLECFFPTSGTANCDVSLVDGYSLSVTCKAGGQTIGGPVDLWTDGHTCGDQSLKGQGICKNDNGYAASQSDVGPFFQPAISGGNQYCIWVNCSQDYYFPVTDSISCHISGTNAS